MNRARDVTQEMGKGRDVQDAEEFDVTAAMEGQKLGRFTIGLVLVSWLVTFFDGFDMNVIGFANKPLEAAFHLNDASMGVVLSAAVWGLLGGGFLFGYIADRIGRRPAIILATTCFSTLTLLLAFARNLPEFLVLRFLNGLALGGAIPLVWVLNTEFAPKKFRATAVTLIMLGYGFGVAFAGPIAVQILPRFGWQGLFLFGGIASFVATALLIAALPESVRFLASKARGHETIRRTLGRMGIQPPAGVSRFLLTDEHTAAGQEFRIWMLFQGELRILTPLLWAAYFASSMSTFFLSLWGPRIFLDLGFSANNTAWVTLLNSLCSMTGGLSVMRFTDKHGPISAAVMPLVAAPLLLVAGLTPMSLLVFLCFSAPISVFLGGGHYAITSIVGLFYPSAIRANGAGWASAVSKIGSALGPMIGGYVLSLGIHAKTTFALLAACPIAYGTCLLAVGLVARRGGAWKGAPTVQGVQETA
jgi:AAHS family 4-hydroxybenzoate transporter-like MFS transporter